MPAPKRATRTRQMTICRKGFARGHQRYVFFPIISLSGKWLRGCGFKPGQVVNIACEDSRLVITIAKEQRFGHGGHTQQASGMSSRG